MNKHNNFARQLAENDTKSLSQKLTKTMEEVGELASAILMYEDATGVRHRFTVKEQILEEVVDVVLCAQSIAHSLNFTDDEIESVIHAKLTKWHRLQTDEQDTFAKSIPYEIHITVNINNDEIGRFEDTCKEIGVKPIVLDLQRQNGGSIMDVMTSSVHYGSHSTAHEKMIDISKSLQTRNFNVVREKIETVPWHPAAPKTQSDIVNDGCYFESHLAVICDDESVASLKQLSSYYGAHLSRNKFKSIDNDNYVMMTKLRSHHTTYDNFNTLVQEFKKVLCYGFTVQKTIIVYTIHDSKVNRDNS